MIPRAFGYVRPPTLDAALAAIGQYGDQGKVMAGGHSLLPMMKLRLAAPDVLIDVNELPELHGIVVRAGTVRIGAASTHATIEHHRELTIAVPLLSKVASVIADATVRNRGTIGGSLVHADPSADWPAAVLALDAKFEIVGPEGTRTVPASGFFKGLFETEMRPGELLLAIHIEAVPGSRAAYLKFRHPASGYAVVGAAIVLEGGPGACSGGRIAITGFAARPFRATSAEDLLVGYNGQADRTDQIVDAAFRAATPLEDRFADAEYRLQLGRTMVRRALAEAISE